VTKREIGFKVKEPDARYMPRRNKQR